MLGEERTSVICWGCGLSCKCNARYLFHRRRENPERDPEQGNADTAGEVRPAFGTGWGD